ncbi:class B sortase [Breznakia pachnodae]|uniref:Sortase B n=1 Tax=Breznakia pachnodae TaxID=265178 RepID=A0ABU0E1W8_9FIRM|nr:class B sortase [Breznakia pachnodae]MDQ0360713.1 sortase B [Breznakia pachnodae]
MKQQEHNSEINKTELKKIKIVHKISNTIDNILMIIFILLLFYGSYALYDSNQVHNASTATQYEQYKPSSDDTLSFEELKEINSDVKAWLSVYGTNIDYPVVHSTNNQKYLNTNALGEASLSGAIYMDFRNSEDFSDFNTIIYGHHMEKQTMFGELDLFKDEEYFEEHEYGNLYYNGEDHGIEFFAFLEADAYDSYLYSPIKMTNTNRFEYIEYIKSNAMNYRDIEIGENDQIVVLSTCASLQTNGRYVVVGKISNELYENTYIEERNSGGIFSNVPYSIIDFLLANPLIGIFVLIILIILILLILQQIARIIERHKRKKRLEELNENNQESNTT